MFYCRGTTNQQMQNPAVLADTQCIASSTHVNRQTTKMKTVGRCDAHADVSFSEIMQQTTNLAKMANQIA
jgi:hypothetical protein